MKSTKFVLSAFIVGVMIFLAQAAASEPASQANFDSEIGYELVGSGFSLPTAVTSTGVQGDDRLFVLEKNGRLRILKDGEILEADFLDISALVTTNSERGLLGMAFDPNYAENGFFYINYSDSAGDTVVARYTVSADPNVADAGSAFTIIEIEQDFQNHNGGWLAFDPNLNLVIGMGDGGSGGDPNNRALSRDTLLGKMVRINVHGSGLPADDGCGRVKNYHIPEDNPRPFGSDDWCPEIWSYGWRNPWRFSFDAQTGDMWAGDVGQNAFEEINFEAAGSPPLQNYGWRCYEGFSVYEPANCTIDPADRTDPVTDYPRSEGTSVTGGYVYRGLSYPDMQGVYFFGDFASGQMWALTPDGDRFAETTLDKTSFNISSFGEGSNDELYLASYGSGEIYQLVGQFGARISISSPAMISTGAHFTTTITVTNVGSDDLDNVQVHNTIPAGVNHSSGGTVVDGAVRIDVGQLAAGQSTTVSWVGQATSFGGTIISGEVTVSASELSSDVTSDPAESASTLIVPGPVFNIYLPVTIR